LKGRGARTIFSLLKRGKRKGIVGKGDGKTMQGEYGRKRNRLGFPLIRKKVTRSFAAVCLERGEEVVARRQVLKGKGLCSTKKKRKV